MFNTCLKTQLLRLHPNAPLKPTSSGLTKNSVKLDWNDVTGAKSYVIHYGTDTDPTKAIYMQYSEVSEFTMTDAIYGATLAGTTVNFWVQTFNKVGQGANDIAKAQWLNTTQTGSAWSPMLKVDFPAS